MQRVIIFPEIWLLGIRFHQLTVCELIAYIVDRAGKKDKTIVGNVNIRAVNFASDLSWYKDFINTCDIVFCDGFGVLLAAKLNGYTSDSQHRMTCPDYIESLAKSCANANRSLFLLAGKPGVTDEAIAKLTAIAPNLKIAGHHGYFEKTGQENDTVIDQINHFKPDVLYIGFGMPLQEKWIIDNIDRVDARVFLPLGACLDFYTGSVRRAPKFITDNGLEWLSRLLTEPRRLWSRYLVGNTLFFYRVFRELTVKTLKRKLPKGVKRL